MLLDDDSKAGELTAALVREVRLPPKAIADAYHIAISARNGIDYLVTWNCRHIANAVLRPMIQSVCRSAGCEPPIICTPLEFELGGANDD
jgi:hypothetical protein